MSDYDDDLMEYETEAEQPEPVTPVSVCLDGPVVTVETVPQHLTCSTVVLTSDQPVAQLLELDHLRVGAQVSALDNDVVVCHSYQQAMDAANQVSTLDMPNGFVVAKGVPATSLRTTQQLWVVTGTYPSRVSVVAERRSV